MKPTDVVIVLLLAVFFLGVGLVTGLDSIRGGHLGTGLVIIVLGTAGFKAVAVAGYLAATEKD